jgi:hypothetical protein
MKTIIAIVDKEGNKVLSELTGKTCIMESSIKHPDRTHFYIGNNMVYLKITGSKLTKILTKFLKSRKKVLDLSKYTAYLQQADIDYLEKGLREAMKVPRGFLTTEETK